MSYQALARKYRPQSFHDIIGQETVVQTLQNAIRDQRIHHAYLFSGVRGVGKTTGARILAKALNCIHGPAIEPCNECSICQEITEGIDLDVREIDAATYTGVDNVRELREVTQFQPARDRYRIFIIDEAHMLSTAAWNALLKVIEEPPPHVIFMFATTEIHKVPHTIISRVQKQMLRKNTVADVVQRLQQIVPSEGIEPDRAALAIVARRGEGSVRDSLSLLDQIIAFSGRTITVDDVSTILGLSDNVFFSGLISLIADGDHAGILDALEEAATGGRDFRMLYRDLLNFVRNLLLMAGGANEAMLSASPEDLVTLRATADKFSYTELLRIANLLLRDDETVNKAEHQRLAVEIAVLKAATFPRLRSVEETLAGGVAVASAPSPSKPRAASSGQRAATADSFLTLLQKKRPLLAGYATGAKQSRKEGNRLILTFEDVHLAEPLIDARAALSEIAAEAFGGPTEVVIETESEKPTGRRAEDQPSLLRDDPVLKAFQKHLGGELVKEKR